MGVNYGTGNMVETFPTAKNYPSEDLGDVRKSHVICDDDKWKKLEHEFLHRVWLRLLVNRGKKLEGNWPKC